MEKALEKIRASKKYGDLCEDTILRVLRECFERHKKPKDAEKAAREKLHGITGAFISRDDLVAAKKYLDENDIENALDMHASTRERKPLDDFYGEIWKFTGVPRTALDLACGMNPVYLASRGINVTGIDIDGGLMNAINSWAEKFSMPAKAVTADLLCENAIPEAAFDVTFIMKLLPVIDAQKTGAAAELLSKIKHGKIVATFPTRTLGGRNVGMERHYSEWFEKIIPENTEIIAKYTKNNELVYILEVK